MRGSNLAQLRYNPIVLPAVPRSPGSLIFLVIRFDLQSRNCSGIRGGERL
jgi:hypothetical protein